MTRVWPIVLLAFAGCFPSFDDRPWIVDDTRILAVRGVPAEQLPNGSVTYEALVASPDGTMTTALEWAYCTEPRRAEERTGVTASCARGDDLEPIAADATVLAAACNLFGPNPPPVEGDEAPRRPSDPDPSGGYYLPVRARVGADAITFGFQRIRCDLAGATRAIFDEYQDRYTLNQHPTLAAATADGVDLLSAAAAVDAGATVELVGLPAADAAEPYIVYIAEEVAIVDRTETLTVTWYLTGGELSATTGTTVRWTAPSTAGPVHGWIILGDDRGGSTWTSVQFDVR